jgi:hypothetical protein
MSDKNSAGLGLIDIAIKSYDANSCLESFFEPTQVNFQERECLLKVELILNNTEENRMKNLII